MGHGATLLAGARLALRIASVVAFGGSEKCLNWQWNTTWAFIELGRRKVELLPDE